MSLSKIYKIEALNDLVADVAQVRPEHCHPCSKSCLCLSALLSLSLKAQTVGRPHGSLLSSSILRLVTNRYPLALRLTVALTDFLSMPSFSLFPISFLCFLFFVSLGKCFSTFFGNDLPIPCAFLLQEM